MFELEDILIIGDSFVGARTQDTDWPKILTKLLTNNNGTPRGKGFDGCSWWSVRKRLLLELKKQTPKVLILAHTEPGRLPNDKDLPLNIMSVDETQMHDNVFLNNTLKEAAVSYYKHLMSKDFHIWAQQQWFYELDTVLEKYNIPYTIHLHCFLPWTSESLYEFQHGITFDTPLWELSDDIKQWSNDNRNHFSLENNKLIANALYQALKTYSNGKRPLNL